MKTLQQIFLLLFCFIAGTGNAQNITTIGLGHRFTYAADIAQDSNGNIYICDSTDDLIMKIDSNNKTTVISAGNGKPTAIALDDLNRLYVAYASPGTNGGKVFKMNNDGSNPVLFSSPNTAITNLKFLGVYLWFTTPAVNDKLGRIYINDGSVGYTNPMGDNTNATDFTFDSAGNVYFTFGSTSNQIMKINSTFTAYSYINVGTTASCIDFCSSIGLVISGQSKIVLMNTSGTIITSYSLPVADVGSAFLPVAVAAKDFQTAHFSVFTGNGYLPYDFKYPDNTFTMRGSQFTSPAGIAFDPASNSIFITDIDVNTGYKTIKKIKNSTYEISNIYNTTNELGALSLTPDNKLYVADRTNNSIRSVSLDGIYYSEVITGLNAPYLARSSGTSDIYSQSNTPNLVKKYFMFPSGWTYINIGSGLLSPRGFDMDTSGNYYVANYLDNTIKKITPDNTTAGIGTGFHLPSSIVLKDNYLYIADTGNNAIKRMNTDGSNIITIGSGFNQPEGICLNADGSKLFVADTGNNLLKVIDLSNLLGTSDAKEQPKIQIYPNPATDFINIKSAEKIKSAEIFDMSGKTVAKFSNTQNLEVRALEKGVYVIKISTEKGINQQKFIKKQFS
ncbi:MAG: T9SS type A sorting domain-containing protein [Bergeyella sp.]